VDYENFWIIGLTAAILGFGVVRTVYAKKNLDANTERNKMMVHYEPAKPKQTASPS